MKHFRLLPLLLFVCAASLLAQTTDDLLNDGKNTENVTTQSMGYARQNFSPLKQINTSNVRRLVPLWTTSVMNVYLLMSGLFTPIDSMAPWVQTVTLINPVRHFVTISRAILMKGAGPAEIAQPFLILLGTAIFVLVIAVAQYRKRAA